MLVVEPIAHSLLIPRDNFAVTLKVSDLETSPSALTLSYPLSQQ